MKAALPQKINLSTILRNGIETVSKAENDTSQSPGKEVIFEKGFPRVKLGGFDFGFIEPHLRLQEITVPFCLLSDLAAEPLLRHQSKFQRCNKRGRTIENLPQAPMPLAGLP